jgi:hypothetical protein
MDCRHFRWPQIIQLAGKDIFAFYLTSSGNARNRHNPNHGHAWRGKPRSRARRRNHHPASS